MPISNRPPHALGAMREAQADAASAAGKGAALSTKVKTSTAFAPDKNYKVKLSGVATYLKTKLSPMHLHVVSGTVAQAIRGSIDSFDLVQD